MLDSVRYIKSYIIYIILIIKQIATKCKIYKKLENIVFYQENDVLSKSVLHQLFHQVIATSGSFDCL